MPVLTRFLDRKRQMTKTSRQLKFMQTMQNDLKAEKNEHNASEQAKKNEPRKKRGKKSDRQKTTITATNKYPTPVTQTHEITKFPHLASPEAIYRLCLLLLESLCRFLSPKLFPYPSHTYAYNTLNTSTYTKWSYSYFKATMFEKLVEPKLLSAHNTMKNSFKSSNRTFFKAHIQPTRQLSN